MFKIAIDVTPVDLKPSGVGFYVFNLLRELNALQKDEGFQLETIYQPRFKEWLRGDLSFPSTLKEYSQPNVLPIPVRVLNSLIDLELKSVLSHLEKYIGYPDILHGTNYSVYPCKKSLNVISIYDLSFIKYPQYVNSVAHSYTERVKHCLSWSKLILTISESSKRDIIEYLRVDPNKIYVTPLASRYSNNYPSQEIEFSEDIKQTLNLDFAKPYLLFVSTIEPRKNINTLLESFNLLKSKYKIEHQLVLIGRKGWKYQPIFAAIEDSPWKSEIHHLDYLSSELVAWFYTNADVFVYPSHYEGFGLPVLEAMTLGAPIVASNTSSLPEVAGDAAILVEPTNPFELAEAILQVINNLQLRQRLVTQGRERAKLFSWRKTAMETLKAYRTLMS